VKRNYTRDPKSGALILHDTEEVNRFRKEQTSQTAIDSMKSEINTLREQIESLRAVIQTIASEHQKKA
jgi:prefoldin subunit 5